MAQVLRKNIEDISGSFNFKFGRKLRIFGPFDTCWPRFRFMETLEMNKL